MRSGVVVLLKPVIDHYLRLLGRREPLRIENLPSQGAIEALVVSVLPGIARQGIVQRCPERGDPG